MIKSIPNVENIYLASNHQVFWESKERLTNISEKLLYQIKRLNHLPKNHQIYMNMIHIMIHPEVVKYFPIDKTNNKEISHKKKKRHQII